MLNEPVVAVDTKGKHRRRKGGDFKPCFRLTCTIPAGTSSVRRTYAACVD